jgi:hypothetical protein
MRESHASLTGYDTAHVAACGKRAQGCRLLKGS